MNISPSRMASFTSCPLAFRFVNIEHLTEPPSVHTTKGSLVHRALELLFVNLPDRRTAADARQAYDRAVDEFRLLPDLVDLHLSDDAEAAFLADGWSLVESYLAMEDPAKVRAIGVELWMETAVGELGLRGIIDRLDLDDDGGLVIVDYKTGKPPAAGREERGLGGVHFYSLLCEQVLGRRPAAIRLMYLRSGLTITAYPTAQSVRFVTTRAAAIHAAIEQACATDSFLPKPGGLCATCAFQRWCPAFGGDPRLAAAEAPHAAQPVEVAAA